MGYILSIDQGTTGSTAALINDNDFTFFAKENLEYPQIFPEAGLVEHNLADIWSSVKESIKLVLSKNNINPSDISSIGITNQRETICAFDSNNNFLHNALVWQDRRTSNFCNENKANEEKLKKLTGLPLDPYFSGSKIKWLLENVPAIKNSTDLRFGTVDTFLLSMLTNGKSYFTEPSNASRTMLMNIESCQWDSTLLGFFGVKKENLPQIKNSFDNFGETSGLDFLPDGIKITGILGDQQAALFGQAGHKRSSIKCTYGTGAFMLLNTGEDLKRSKSGLLSTVAYKSNDSVHYALEGSCYIAGAAVGWLRDGLKIIKTSPDVEDLAKQVKNIEEMKNVLFLPFFTGLGSPYWKDGTASILGLTRDTTNAHIAKACLDGIALSIDDLIRAFVKDSGESLSELKVDGGAVKNNLLMETQATVSQINIIRPKVIETTAYGAALASAIGNGILKIDELNKFWSKESHFSPESSLIKFYEHKKESWSSLISKLY